MKVILVMVQTADGRTTIGNDPDRYDWSSQEDHAHFAKLKAAHRVLVMGKNTYVALRDTIRPNPSLRRIVLTRHPDEFAAQTVPGQLDFMNIAPDALISRLEAEGYESLLLVGGSVLNRAFLEKKLITECYITIEPRFFGSGNTVFAPFDTDIALRLLEVTRLNANGSVLLHYKIV